MTNLLLRPKFLLFASLLLIVLLHETSAWGVGKRTWSRGDKLVSRVNKKPAQKIIHHAKKTRQPIGWNVGHSISKPMKSYSSSGSKWNFKIPQTTRRSSWRQRQNQRPKKPIHFNVEAYMKSAFPTPHYQYYSNDPYRHRYFSSSNLTNQPIVPEKNLTSQNYIEAPITSCGMTLCSDVLDYPTDEISRAVKRARELSKTAPPNSIEMLVYENSGLNVTSRYDDFWYGQEAPEHGFVNASTNCGEHVSTYYPKEGYSNKKSYYVVNVPSFRQGLTRIQCESTFQKCNHDASVSETETKECRQLFRQEKLLTLPMGKTKFDITDFIPKSFFVPTGCACLGRLG